MLTDMIEEMDRAKKALKVKGDHKPTDEEARITELHDFVP